MFALIHVLKDVWERGTHGKEGVKEDSWRSVGGGVRESRFMCLPMFLGAAYNLRLSLMTVTAFHYWD